MSHHSTARRANGGMKVVLFCGGQGLRMRDYSENVPKPMVPIGQRPILWHLMKYYAHYGHRDFILCLGHRAEAVKEYFLDYKEWLSNDFVLNGRERSPQLKSTDIDDWRITFVDTGIASNIGQRLCAVREYLGDDEVFMANYSDGLIDLHLPDLVAHYHAMGRTATMVCAPPGHSFHMIQLDEGHRIARVQEAREAGLLVNAGFFIFHTDVFDYIRPGEELVHEPFGRLIAADEITGFRHTGFWAGMDTFKEQQQFNDMWSRGEAPWAVWNRTTPAVDIPVAVAS
jgi:glucose-1-phosphate cytidylyltransferase